LDFVQAAEFHRVYSFPSIALPGLKCGPIVEYEEAEGEADCARFRGGRTESRLMISKAVTE
jgi:hypothetical protein